MDSLVPMTLMNQQKIPKQLHTYIHSCTQRHTSYNSATLKNKEVVLNNLRTTLEDLYSHIVTRVILTVKPHCGNISAIDPPGDTQKKCSVHRQSFKCQDWVWKGFKGGARNGGSQLQIWVGSDLRVQPIHPGVLFPKSLSASRLGTTLTAILVRLGHTRREDSQWSLVGVHSVVFRLEKHSLLNNQ